MKPIFHGEMVRRITLDKDIMSDPERLFTYVAVSSLSAMAEAKQRHYSGFGVSAVAPVYDSEWHPKVLTATNYRPDPEKSRTDTRVCAEQALIDNSVHEGDLSHGIIFIRGPKPDPEKPIVGCREGMRSLHMCRPCRARMLDVIGPKLLIVSFNDDDPEPTEAMTLGQMLGYHDAETKYPELPKGKSARDVAIDALTNLPDLKKVNKPTRARRSITAAERN